MKTTRKNTTESVDNMVLNGIVSVLEKGESKVWLGTMTELNTSLVKALGRKQAKGLPGSPSALRLVVNRVLNRLRYRGVSVKFGRTTDSSRTRFVRFTR